MKCTKKAKMILVPYPAQGHVTPMLKLASAFHNREIFDTILITPEFIHHQIASSIEPKDQILCMPIPDGLDKDTPRDFFAIEMAMEKNMPVHLEAMIHKLVEDGEVVCVVVDLLASWAIEVANRCRVPVAGFWPVMFAAYEMIAAIPDMVRTGLVSDTEVASKSMGDLLEDATWENLYKSLYPFLIPFCGVLWLAIIRSQAAKVSVIC